MVALVVAVAMVAKVIAIADNQLLAAAVVAAAIVDTVDLARVDLVVTAVGILA